MKSIIAITKRLLSSNKVSFIITVLVVLCATTSGDSQTALSNGNYSWLFAVMAPFFIVFYDYTKMMYLGANKKDYFIGSVVSYTVAAILISIINSIIHAVIDPINQTQNVINMMDVCTWSMNGIMIAFMQQAAFLLLVMAFLHMLLSMQCYWYGWLTDAILVAIICVFTPIAPLRQILSGFFGTIMFNSNALQHIAICLLLSASFLAISLVILKRKTL